MNSTESPDNSDLIDVKQLIADTSVEDLNKKAEEYFAKIENWDYHLAKPFGSVDEASQLLTDLAVVLKGLDLCRGLTVMEFGAGSCWASRYLSQLFCKVIAVDVSETALKMGRELYARQPVFGKTLEPEFLLFDGHRIELADKSVDRIICLHALHHVPNPEAVLREFGRVLVDGGIAGFAEPGPEHSRSAQSQEEMRKFGVIENDIDTPAIWSAARLAGFTEIKLAVFSDSAMFLSQEEFDDFMNCGPISERVTQQTRDSLRDQRTFFLYKGARGPRDSRFRAGLKAGIYVEPDFLRIIAGEPIVFNARVVNRGSSIWLPRSAGIGAVLLGCHVRYKNGDFYRQSYHWEPLTAGEGRRIYPDEWVGLTVTLPALPVGDYEIEFDLVSNEVGWFSHNDSPTAKVRLTIDSKDAR